MRTTCLPGGTGSSSGFRARKGPAICWLWPSIINSAPGLVNRPIENERGVGRRRRDGHHLPAIGLDRGHRADCLGAGPSDLNKMLSRIDGDLQRHLLRNGLHMAIDFQFAAASSGGRFSTSTAFGRHSGEIFWSCPATTVTSAANLYAGVLADNVMRARRAIPATIGGKPDRFAVDRDRRFALGRGQVEHKRACGRGRTTIGKNADADAGGDDNCGSSRCRWPGDLSNPLAAAALADLPPALAAGLLPGSPSRSSQTSAGCGIAAALTPGPSPAEGREGTDVRRGGWR